MNNIVELLEHTDNTFTHVMYIPDISDITTLNNVIDHITINDTIIFRNKPISIKWTLLNNNFFISDSIYNNDITFYHGKLLAKQVDIDSIILSKIFINTLSPDEISNIF